MTADARTGELSALRDVERFEPGAFEPLVERDLEVAGAVCQMRRVRLGEAIVRTLGVFALLIDDERHPSRVIGQEPIDRLEEVVATRFARGKIHRVVPELAVWSFGRRERYDGDRAVALDHLELAQR